MLPRRCSRALVAAALALGLGSALAQSARVIVSLKPDAGVLREHPMALRAAPAAVARLAQNRADALAARAGVVLSAGAPISERAQVLFASGIDAQQLAQRLAQDPQVEYAVVDRRRRALLVPTDPLYAAGPASGRGPAIGQWYLQAPAGDVRSSINAEAAWDRITGQPGVVVAVVDTGVLGDHLDLSGVVLPGYDFVTDARIANDGDGRDADAGDPGDWVTAAETNARNGPFSGCGESDSSWHGTQIAGVIAAAANNGQGMAGVAWGARILPVRVLGKCGGYDSDIQAGMRWAAGLAVPGVPANPHPARIINLSLGSTGACDASSGYPQLIGQLLAQGTVVVAAAGNTAGHSVGLPANCPGVIAVAGLRHAGSKVGFSDLGPEIAISAPGGNCVNIGAGEPCLYPILTSSNSGTRAPNAGGSVWTDSFDISVGTSFTSPIVAGSLALMLSARPELLAEELRSLVRASARPFPTSGAGDDENGQPVQACRVPDGRDQLQCYCSVGLCGAGMLDAAAAVQAALGTLARIASDPATPIVGDSVRLRSTSLPAAGRSIVAYAWRVDGSAVSAIAGAADAAEIMLQALAVGSARIELSVTDDQGTRTQTVFDLIVSPVPLPPAAAAPADSGGGAMAGLWVALLGLAVAALLHERRLQRRAAPPPTRT